MDRHVTDVIRRCNFRIRALRHIRSSLDLHTAKMIAHGFVSARLDYCNRLLSGTSGGNFDRLQVVQIALARTMCRAPWAGSITELRRSLHWVPIRQRVEYKLAVITYNAIQTNTPSTLASLIDSYRTTRTLRSSDKYLLSHPFIKLSLATKAFSVSAIHLFGTIV